MMLLRSFLRNKKESKVPRKRMDKAVAQEPVVNLEKYKSLKLLEEYRKKYYGITEQIESIDKIINLVLENRAVVKIVEGKIRLFTPQKIKMKLVRIEENEPEDVA